MDLLLEYDGIRYAFLTCYATVLFVLCVYGIHRYILVHLFYKYRRNLPELKACFRELPVVTVQLPMYNESAVARRVIDATCRIDYPREKLEIQVLDDSTDETVEIVAEAVKYWRERGIDIHHVHRVDRTGFKAGALEAGMKKARGEFVLIFDADFLPERDVLKETIHHFSNPRVGMVQTRWEHLNREQSLLTRTQAIMLDGHFVMEHGARNRSGRFMSFNGTAGLWRRTCIEDAGGWEHDTLTEDLDLSYRAQMKGWKFVFLPQLTAPAELPPDMEAFKQQQHRWAKGGAQTARKLLPAILGSRLPKRIKFEAFFHLTSCIVYPCIVLLTFMLYPVVFLKVNLLNEGFERYVLDFSIVLLATCSAGTFYVCSQRELFKTWSDSLKYIPFLMSLGIGVSLNNTRAVLSGFFGKPGEFVRTPKFGAVAGSTSWKTNVKKTRRGRRIKLQPWFEFGIGCYLAACLWQCISTHSITIGVPFLCLFMIGYFYVPLNQWFGHRIGKAAQTMPADLAPAPATDAQSRLAANRKDGWSPGHPVLPDSAVETKADSNQPHTS